MNYSTECATARGEVGKPAWATEAYTEQTICISINITMHFVLFFIVVFMILVRPISFGDRWFVFILYNTNFNSYVCVCVIVERRMVVNTNMQTSFFVRSSILF